MATSTAHRFTSSGRRLAAAFGILALAGCGGSGGYFLPLGDGGASADGGIGPQPDLARPGADAATPTSGPVDPACLDGMYAETLPDPTVSIDDLVRAFTRAGAESFLFDLLDRRYSIGSYIVQQALGHPEVGNCLDQFFVRRDSPDGVYEDLETVVHECGHMFDIGESTFRGSTYVFTPSLRMTCSGGSGDETYARSRIRGDAYSASRPPCNGSTRPGCDGYADVYLDGNPDNATFEGGDQGIDTVLEETVQYVNSLAVGLALRDELAATGFTRSNRDGIATFLWYLERYLAMARTDYPQVHARILGDACWRRVILTAWGRAWLYLGATARDRHLGIEDDAILRLVNTPALLDEIQRVRAAHGC